MQTPRLPGLWAVMRDLAERAMSIRTEQATVPPSRYDLTLRTTRRSVVEAQRLSRRLHGQGWDARLPG